MLIELLYLGQTYSSHFKLFLMWYPNQCIIWGKEQLGISILCIVFRNQPTVLMPLPKITLQFYSTSWSIFCKCFMHVHDKKTFIVSFNPLNTVDLVNQSSMKQSPVNGFALSGYWMWQFSCIWYTVTYIPQPTTTCARKDHQIVQQRPTCDN